MKTIFDYYSEKELNIIINNIIEKIKRELKKLGYGKLIIRTNIEPKGYWGLRKKFESEGEKRGFLFLLDEWFLAAKQQDL